ncbi:hypothetical protein HMPREF1870_02836 [Bacteroidales bacterium KA00344]|nr:hypothetical protein HMPREF1870_02836 [Bacteroidales bacterium KA00344]
MCEASIKIELPFFVFRCFPLLFLLFAVSLHSYINMVKNETKI